MLTSRLIRTGTAGLLALQLHVGTTAAAEPRSDWPKLHTNQEMIEDASRAPSIDTKDPLAVLDFVLKSLPARVKVYPTENYYYFWFWHDHVKWAGNLRLDPQERDRGLINFAYFEDYTEWAAESKVNHRLLGADDGVTVEKLAPLVYRVTFRGTAVEFALNDLSETRPPEGFLRPTEVYVGPVLDDSGLPFYLVWNKDQKLFHYILNEQAPAAEAWRASRVSPRILIGNRTGFALYRDRYRDRKILIGIYASNAAVNNYYDGPFDQLPDTFIKDDTLHDAILALEPSLKGKIDRFGNSPGGKERFLIGPYMQWRTEEDLAVVKRCAADPKIKGERWYGCFVIERQ
jgi:hypothetical protein